MRNKWMIIALLGIVGIKGEAQTQYRFKAIGPGTDNQWTNELNWIEAGTTAAVIPGTNDIAIISKDGELNTTAILNTLAVATEGQNNNVTFDINDGDSLKTSIMRIASYNGTNNTGTVNVNSGGTLHTTSGEFRMGGVVATATGNQDYLNVNSGGTATIEGMMYIGYRDSNEAVITVGGVLNTQGKINMGQGVGTTGRIDILDGGVMNANGTAEFDIGLGDIGFGSGEVNVAGTLNTSASYFDIAVGVAGKDTSGSLTVTETGVLSGAGGAIRLATGAGNACSATMTVMGVVSNSDVIQVGSSSATSTAALKISGPKALVQVSGFNFNETIGGETAMVVSNGAQFVSEGWMNCAGNSSGEILIADGGSFSVAKINTLNDTIFTLSGTNATLTVGNINPIGGVNGGYIDLQDADGTSSSRIVFTGAEESTITNLVAAGTITNSLWSGQEDWYQVAANGNGDLVLSAIQPVTEIKALEMVGESLLKITINSTDQWGQLKLVGTSDLLKDEWDYVAHSDNGSNAFVVTNLLYSTQEDAATCSVYVQATNSAVFFGIE
ncbi:hypothetical protein [Tichowtungia aerotolerans]|uniref:Uncharacterized protein n=1 Tax=Tichowtungia aerotolerans TaxID=2697043 RepID=A0A6P1MDQ3_9BACT|nr:hypothetical protein [Tichowtungia aerotolerans]QHI69716.1 hypothetical protein GT409_09710 [Tichowtungia aerotolerans]